MLNRKIINLKKFGNTIKKLRNENDYTMEELSDIFNKRYGTAITKNMICKWENGKVLPDLHNVIPYIKFFNISFDDLVIKNARFN